MDATAMPCQALVKMLAKKPGWKETNFQVTLSSHRETHALIHILQDNQYFQRKLGRFIMMIIIMLNSAVFVLL